MQQQENFFIESKKALEKYVQDKLLLLKLQTAEKVSRLTAIIISLLLIALFSFFILLFISMMAGYYFAALTGSTYVGFGIVALLYIILLTVIILFRKKLIEKTVTKIVIKIFIDKTDDDAHPTP